MKGSITILNTARSRVRKMSKTKRDRMDWDNNEYSRSKIRKELSRKRKNKNFGRNRSSDELLEEYSIEEDNE